MQHVVEPCYCGGEPDRGKRKGYEMNFKLHSLAASAAIPSAIFCVGLIVTVMQGCGDGKTNQTANGTVQNTPDAPTKITMGQPSPSTRPESTAPPSATLSPPADPKPTTVRPTTAPATQPAPIGSPAAPAAGESKVATFGEFKAPKPATWQWQPIPSSDRIRLAHYIVPGRDGADQATITVSQASGDLNSNITRWVGQFRSDGEPIEPKLDTVLAADMKITIVEIAGEYGGMSGAYTPDQLFITAVVPTVPQQTFIKFVGPSKTVEANRKEFRAMIEGLERVDPEK
jgi:hypothetical protein